ncbi:MAG TPA: YihA family ribosome biogenesis GTP-binding protein, partial [Pseudomonadales bacterium]|nr:YihA family ribosome biogenesis GTP-binding protein [Pseudomonadales bacterium]
LVDVRHLLKDFDQQMVSWAVHQQLPVHILLTKADKLARGAASKQLLTLRKDLAPFAELVSVQLFSALKKQGLDDVHEVLTRWFDMPTEPTTNP